MPETLSLAILSDIHYACAAEQARGDDYEIRGVANPLLRLLLNLHRRYLWLREPMRQNHLLDRFLAQTGAYDYVIANGDYSINSNHVGLSDDAAFESARECLEKLRRRFAPHFKANYGDHELGKSSFFGGIGGMRLASWYRSTAPGPLQDQKNLGLEPFWQVELGSYVLMGVVSSLIALPVYEHDTLPEDRPEWEALREQHLTRIRSSFAALRPDQRLLFFCHDPTALPFLWREEAVRARIRQIEQTLIGHLHSNLIYFQSRLLSGMPAIRFLGRTARRMSSALREARHWRPFKVRLCPSLAGIQLLNDGGYYTAELDAAARRPVRFTWHPLPRP
jgi:hypothetical protein